MNMLTTPAIGAPNSFLRRVQVDPTIAMGLLLEVCKVTDAFERGEFEATILLKVADLAEYVAAMKVLHNLTETER